MSWSSVVSPYCWSSLISRKLISSCIRFSPLASLCHVYLVPHSSPLSPLILVHHVYLFPSHFPQFFPLRPSSPIFPLHTLLLTHLNPLFLHLAPLTLLLTSTFLLLFSPPPPYLSFLPSSTLPFTPLCLASFTLFPSLFLFRPIYYLLLFFYGGGVLELIFFMSLCSKD